MNNLEVSKVGTTALADRVTEAGVAIAPVVGTVLASQFESIDPHTLTQRPGMSVDREAVTNIAAVLTNIMRTLREGVAGGVERVMTDARANMNRSQVTDENPYEIIAVPTSAVYDEPTLASIVERYGQVAYRDTKGGQVIVTVDSVIELSGITDVTRAIAGDLPTVEAVVGLINGSTNMPAELDSIETAYLMHMVAQQLYDNPPSGVTGRLEDYNAYIANLVAQSGRLISLLHDRELRESRMDTLYIDRHYPNNAKKLIVVRESSYLKALDAGLTPEALIANEMEGRVYRSVTDLIENASGLANVYQMRISEIRRTIDNDQYEHILSAVNQGIQNEINRHFDKSDVSVEDQAAAHARHRQCMQTYGYAGGPVETLVGRCLIAALYHEGHVLDAFEMLVGLDHHEGTLADGCTDVLVTLVYKWIASQIAVN